MPCLDFLAQLREHHQTLLDRGADVIGVGGAADYQAAKLQEAYPFPLLLDADGVLRSTVGIDTKLGRREMASLTSLKRYVSSMRRQRQGKVSRRHAEDRPAVVVLDADLRVVWGQEGRALGDYPSIDDIRGALT